MIRHPHRTESMGDQDRRLPLDQGRKALKDLILRPGVQRGGRLVQDQELGIPHIGPGKTDLLPLSATQIDGTREPPPQ